LRYASKQTDRQTNKQLDKRQTDTVIAILCTTTGGKVINESFTAYIILAEFCNCIQINGLSRCVALTRTRSTGTDCYRSIMNFKAVGTNLQRPVSTASSLHPDPRLLPQGLDLLKLFQKSIPVPTATVPSSNMLSVLTITSKSSCSIILSAYC